MRFPEGFLQEIKFRNDIEDIISKYVTLKQNGANYVACCPFHSEKTPSFTVFRDSKSYYCFGCGAGGDVITFMMTAENIDYITAVTKLADIAKIPIPEDDGEYRDKMLRQKRIYELNREAALYFHDNLINLKTAEGEKVREYLRKRGLKHPVIRHFGLGYAPESGNNLTRYLSEKGYSKEEQKTAFLCGISKKGEYFDWFRGRVMFPIIDAAGKVIAFGGRTVKPDGMPKYLNSSDTPVFKKSRNLYALNFAKTTKRDYMIMCEGYMDVIAMHQAGFTNAVATLGTAVTGEQARVIAKHTQKIVLAYDSDEAGKRAMQKAAGLLGEAGLEVKVLPLDEAKDPDEFINRYGKEKLENYLNKPKGYVETTLENILQKYDLTTPDEAAMAINESCNELAQINNEIRRDVYATNLAYRFKIPAETILKKIENSRKNLIQTQKTKLIDDEQRKILGYGDRVNPDKIKNPAAVKIEEAILGILLKYPEAHGHIKNILTDNLFISEFNKKIYNIFTQTIHTLEQEQNKTDYDNGYNGYNRYNGNNGNNGNNGGFNSFNHSDFNRFDTALITKDLSPEETSRITKMIVEISKNTNANYNNIKNTIENLVESLKEQNKIIERKNINIKELSGLDDAYMINYIEERRAQEKLKKPKKDK